MSKLVFVLSFLGLGILFVAGLVDPNSPVMWLASTSQSFTILRGVLMLVMLVLIFTNPPRNVYLRAVVGLVTTVAAGWTLSATYQNQMQVLDTMTLLAASISAAIDALERTPKELDTYIRPSKRVLLSDNA